ncbi:hypothetical protein ACFL04_03830 [Patescibacteria group bacterium]
MTQREITTRARLAVKIKKLRQKMDLPVDLYLERALFDAPISDIAGIYEGLKKMERVFQQTSIPAARH